MPVAEAEAAAAARHGAHDAPRAAARSSWSAAPDRLTAPVPGHVTIGLYGLHLSTLEALPPPTRAGSSVWSRRGSLSQMGELEAGAGAGAVGGGRQGEAVGTAAWQRRRVGSAGAPAAAAAAAGLEGGSTDEDEEADAASGLPRPVALPRSTIARLQRLLQRRLTPCSTTADLAALAAEAAAGGSSGASASDSAAAPGSAGDVTRTLRAAAAGLAAGADDGPGFHRGRRRGSRGGSGGGGRRRYRATSPPRPLHLSVDELERLFLYEHMRFAVQSVRVVYCLPAGVQGWARGAPPAAAGAAAPGPTSFTAGNGSAHAYSHHATPAHHNRSESMPPALAPQRQSQPPQPQAAAVEVSLLPSGLHLRGTLSRSRLEQDTSAPSLAVRLALGGLTNSRLHASKVRGCWLVLSFCAVHAGSSVGAVVGRRCMRGVIGCVLRGCCVYRLPRCSGSSRLWPLPQLPTVPLPVPRPRKWARPKQRRMLPRSHKVHRAPGRMSSRLQERPSPQPLRL